MEESIDVKALRDRFNSQTRTSSTSSRDIGPSKTHPVDFMRGVPLLTEEMTQRQVLMGSGTVPGPLRLPKVEPAAALLSSRPGSFPRAAPGPPSDPGRVRQTGEMLQNLMLRHQRPSGPALTPNRSPVPGSSPTTTPLPLRQQPRQRSSGDVTPLLKLLPPEGPLPLKPKRPPHVNLDPFMKLRRGARDQRRYSADIRSPTVVSAPNPPHRSSKPNLLPRQIASVDFEDEQETYDDIGSFEINESYSDNNSHSMDGDDEDDLYEFIDGEMPAEAKHFPAEIDIKRQQEKQRKELMEHQKKQTELKKNFQISPDSEVLHTAKVRYNWPGEGKLDLGVRQGDSVEILRVENNPKGKWLARSMSGQYGYISNKCVDIDYEAVKRRMPKLRKGETLDLPPPPPDPPMMDSNNSDSFADDYDDVQPLPVDFPPPPPEISTDPKIEKELRKKFKYNGPLSALRSMMVDPNAVIKKPGAKDLPVTQGEVVDVISETSSKKFLCQNRFGKYGYVSTSLLLSMEGEIYDDVDYPDDVYDNDDGNMD